MLGVPWWHLVLETKTPITMTDLIYMGAALAFFLFSALYVRFCEKL